MDKVEGHSKLSTPLCEVQDYYRSDSSSLSIKQAFHSETKAESSRTIVALVMIIGINNLEEEMAATKAMLERPLRRAKKRRCIKL